MPVSRDALLDALRELPVPGLDGHLFEHRMLVELATPAQGGVRLVLASPEPTYAHREQLELAIRQRIAPVTGDASVEIAWKPAAAAAGGAAPGASTRAPGNVAAREVAPDDPVPGARNIVLVMSGKGGVGKSTVATNLALCLGRMGHRVGLLDADIYGPSIPTMLGVDARPTTDGEKIQPLTRFGIKLMSIGFLLEEPHAAVVWRGPMLHSALLQFLKDVAWGELDFLLLDLPPGTGDVALTLSQRVRSTGAVIVTTPQEVALQDVYKSVSMARKVGIPVLGIVENESYFVCDGCDKRHEIFGSGGGQKIADMAEAPLLGQIPLDGSVRSAGDGGVPIVQGAPDSPVSKAFVAIAEGLIVSVNRAAAESTAVNIDRSGGVNRHLPVTR